VCVFVCVGLSVCLSSLASAFYCAWTWPLTPLLASMGHGGVTSMPTPPTPTPLISNGQKPQNGQVVTPREQNYVVRLCEHMAGVMLANTWQILISVPSLRVYYCQQLTLSVCLAICHKTSNCFFFFVSRWNQAIFWPPFLHEPLYKTFFFDF